MSKILFYLLFTYCTVKTSKALPSKKSVRFQIDEFIKQLMTSEKFDELADIIANKAAQKIRNMESQGKSYVDTKALRLLDKNEMNDAKRKDQSNEGREINKEKESRFHEKPNNTPEKVNENYSRSSEKSNNDREKNKEKSSRSSETYFKPEKFSKINTQTFLKNHMTSNELDLNFKHLKGELGKHRFVVKGNNKETQKSNENNKKNRPNKHMTESEKTTYSVEEKSVSPKTENNSSKETSQTSSDSSNERQQPNFHDTEDKTNFDMNSGETKSGNNSDSDQKSYEYPIPRIIKRTNVSEEISKSVEDNDNTKALVDEVIQKVAYELKSPSKSSKEIMDVGFHIHNSEKNVSKSPGKQNIKHNKAKSNLQVREENGKQYMLQTSSEYVEYFENLELIMEMISSKNRLVFIDVDEKPPIAVVKEERASSPDEKLSDVKNREKDKLHCAECDRYSCYSADRMTRHIRRVHRGENPFQCAMCEYSTYNSVCFTEHVNIHKGVKPYKCKHCPYRTVSKKYIKMHEMKHGTCNKCGFVAHNRPALKRHRRENACDEEDKEIKQTYFCDACNQFYDTQASLRQHKKGHKKCNLCSKAFCRSVLTVHLAKEHGIEKKPIQKKYKFNCSQCSWSSNWLQKILLHMIHHPDQKLDGSIDVTPLINAGILKNSNSDCD